MQTAVRRLIQPLRHPAIEAALIGTAVAALQALVRMSDAVAVGAFNDDGVYVALGKALADGAGYRSIYAPGEPVHLKYPPGLPLVLAALWKLGGTLEVVARLHGALTLVLNGGAAALVWWLARRELELTRPIAVAFALGPLFMEVVLQYFHLPLGEPYFACLWAAALVTYVVLRARREATGTAPWPAAAGLGLLVAIATLFRTQGIVLVPAFAVALLMDRFRGRIVTTFAGAALGPLVAWSVIHRLMVAGGPVSSQPDEAPYTSWITAGNLSEVAEFATRALTFNWTWYWRGMPGNFADWWLAGVIIVLVLAAAVGGGMASEFRRRPALVLSLAGTIALLAVWPWPHDRFAATFLPFASLLAGRGFQLGLARCRRPLSVAGYVTLSALVISVAVRQIEMRRSAYGLQAPRTTQGVASPGFILLSNTRFLVSVANWTLANTQREDRLLVFSPAAVFLYTQRQAVAAEPAESGIGPSVFDEPGRYLAQRMLDDSVTVVVDGSPRVHAELAALRRRCPETVAFAGTSRGWANVPVFRVLRDETCLRGSVLGEK